MSDFKKFKEEWPSKEKFYWWYDHVPNLWNKSETKTMKDYHNFYLKYHVLLLANVSEEFRHNSSKNYLLCPSHYLNTPGLSWVEVKMTKIEPELVPDSDMYIFFEKCARGGISYISNSYSKANNKYLKLVSAIFLKFILHLI